VSGLVVQLEVFQLVHLWNMYNRSSSLSTSRPPTCRRVNTKAHLSYVARRRRPLSLHCAT
jgi:hypothetical protein